jgi:hypothetical protein
MRPVPQPRNRPHIGRKGPTTVNSIPPNNFGTSAADFGQVPEIDLEQLKKEVDQPIVLQKIGIRTFAGSMEKIVFTATIREIGERFNFQKLLARSDFDTESTHAGNRDITESHWKAIEEFIETDERPYLGMFVVAMRREEAEIELIQEIDQCAWLAKLTVRANAEHPTLLDAQHRTMGAMRAWATVRDLDEDTATAEQLALRDRLASTSVTIEMLFEHERDILSTIFVNMGSTKPITKDLIAVMDRSQFQNRLAAAVTDKSDLFRHRTTYLGVKAGRQLAEKRGRTYEALYSAGNVVDASATIGGVGVRDRSPKQREDLLTKIVQERSRATGRSNTVALDALATEIAALIDYAYERIPGWAELKKGRIDVDDFKDQYVHGTAAGLKVIGIVLAAAKASGLSPQRAIEVMAKVVPWRRDALRDGRDEDGGHAMVHQFFEGTLVKTTQDEKTGKWRGGTAGARRDLYQAAADKVLRAIADADPSLKPIMSPSTYAAVGLVTGAGRGRPKKAIA